MSRKKDLCDKCSGTGELPAPGHAYSRLVKAMNNRNNETTVIAEDGVRWADVAVMLRSWKGGRRDGEG